MHEPDPEFARRRLLERLDTLLDDAPPLVPLDESRFLETHVLYEGRSDQQRRIIDWFAQRIDPPRGTYRVLSVGCGSGILDVPVAASLAQSVGELDYVGVDPNQVECDAFVRRFEQAELPQTAELTVAASTFEAFTDARGFDLVHLVHCMYYLPDPASALRRARSFLRPGGQLVLVHAPCEALNDLAIRFYDKGYGRPTLFADDCAALMDGLEWAYDRSRIEARVDVTPLVGGDPEVALALRDFIVQFDSLQLAPELQSLVDRYLALISAPSPEGPVFIDHPVDVFVIGES
ncbi:MAG: class I SAM-dependent methyltransferase [Myxococcota bacterium]